MNLCKIFNSMCNGFPKEIFGEDIVKQFLESKSDESVIHKDGHELFFKKGDNSFEIRYSYNPAMKDEFIKWCETIDDELFVEACDKYASTPGKSIKDLDENPTEEKIEDFKAVVRYLALEKISKLQQYI